MRRRSLRRRISMAFLGMAALSGLVGGVLAVLFAYTTEDHIFNRLLALEVNRVQEAASRGEPLPQPELPFARYYQGGDLPPFMREALEAEPDRRELFGSGGRHYHLRRVDLADSGETVWVVLQVEDYLVIRPAFTDITKFLALVTLAMTLIAAAVGLYLAHRVSRPLRTLAAEVSALKPDALPKDWGGRYPPDEVGHLADTLRTAFRRIHQFIDREQQFTQDASHELRTPLAVIESCAAMLEKGPDAAQTETLVARIRAASMAMHHSVDALLALAREDDPAKLDEKTSVLPIVERSVVNHASLLGDKPVEVSISVDPGWQIAGDPAALQVLVANLVSNAFRYTERGEIRIERNGEDLLVIDTGVGVDDAIRQDVTRPAVKGKSSPGLGLGLSIVDRLCQRYGWRFELTSSAQGTTARLSLGKPRFASHE